MGGVTLQQLRAFLAVAESDGFATAARGQMGTSRAAVWQSIHRLEQTLAETVGSPVSLFASGGRELSTAGIALLEPARAAVGGATRAVPAVRDSVQALPKLRVNCYPAQVPLAVEAAAEAWGSQDAAPIELVGLGDEARRDSGQGLVESLLAGETDVVMASQSAMVVHASQDVIHRSLYRWHLLAICSESHSYYGREKVPLSALLGGRLATSPRGHESRDLVEPHLVEAANEPLSTLSVDALVELGRSGWGVALVPSDALPVRSLPAGDRGFPSVTVSQKVLSGSIGVSMRRSSQDQEHVKRYFDALIGAAKGRSASW